MKKFVAISDTDMLPDLAPYDGAHVADVVSIHAGQFAHPHACGMHAQDVLDVGISEPMPRNALTACMPVLRDAISDVIVAGAQKQMGRIHARRIVAAVEHPDARRYRPTVEHPGNSMCVYRAPLAGDRAMAVQLFLALTGPFPADIGSKPRWNAVPKTSAKAFASRGATIFFRVMMARPGRGLDALATCAREPAPLRGVRVEPELVCRLLFPALATPLRDLYRRIVPCLSGSFPIARLDG